MKTAFLTLLILITLCSFKNVHAQKEVTPQLLEQLDSLHQNCLDKGKNMWNCADAFNKQVDSLLNIVYREIKSTTTAEKFQTLKKEQLKRQRMA